jgi:hypothetical protein
MLFGEVALRMRYEGLMLCQGDFHAVPGGGGDVHTTAVTSQLPHMSLCCILPTYSVQEIVG